MRNERWATRSSNLEANPEVVLERAGEVRRAFAKPAY